MCLVATQEQSRHNSKALCRRAHKEWERTRHLGFDSASDLALLLSSFHTQCRNSCPFLVTIFLFLEVLISRFHSLGPEYVPDPLDSCPAFRHSYLPNSCLVESRLSDRQGCPMQRAFQGAVKREIPNLCLSGLRTQTPLPNFEGIRGKSHRKTPGLLLCWLLLLQPQWPEKKNIFVRSVIFHEVTPWRKAKIPPSSHTLMAACKGLKSKSAFVPALRLS